MSAQLLRHSRSSAFQSKLSRFLGYPLSPASTTTCYSTHSAEHSRPAPPPIRVAFTDSAGRGVFATRRIGAGELIHTSKPLLSHPSLTRMSNNCNHCLRKLRPGDVAQTQCAPFCGEECKKLSKDFYEVEKNVNWSTYYDYCRSQNLRYPLLVKRFASMVISGATSKDSLEILQPEHLSPGAILKMEEEYGLLRGAFEAAEYSSEDLAFLTKEWYIGVLARIRVNAFRIELVGGSFDDLLTAAAAAVEAQAAVGNAVYMLPSFYNHDCDPNTHITWIDNVDAKVKALRDIEEGNMTRRRQGLAENGIDCSMYHISTGRAFSLGVRRVLGATVIHNSPSNPPSFPFAGFVH